MKKILFTQLFVLLATISFGQINYHDINPDTMVNTWNVFSIVPFSSSPGNSVDIWWHPSPEVVVTTWGNVALLFDATGKYPAKLSVGESIGTSGTWDTASYHPLSSAGIGNWTTDAVDKYLGFRIKKGSTWCYGWLKMSVGTGASSFTLKEWAVDTTGKKINAGQKSTTGVNTIAQARSLTIYPNPASEQIQLQYEAEENTTLMVANAAGTIVKVVELPRGSHNPILRISDWAAGMYYLTIRGTESNFASIIIKQ